MCPRNYPVIGAFFREIHRADELGSGMRKMMRYGKAYGGADPQLIEGDLFRLIINVPEYGAKPAASSEAAQVTPEVTPEVSRLLLVLKDEMDRLSLQSALGLKAEKNFRLLYIRPALDLGVIEMTIPDKPTTSKQKYRLTDQGKYFNDPPMLFVLSDILIVQIHKVPDIEGHEAVFFLDSKRKLFAVGFLFSF